MSRRPLPAGRRLFGSECPDAATNYHKNHLVVKKYDILPHVGDLRIRVISTTKAGFVSAALEGMFAAAGPKWQEPDEEKRALKPESERPFKVEAESFDQLLVDFLNDAIHQASADHEAFVGVRLSFVTDRKIEGAYLGQPIRGFDTEIKAATRHDLKVQKNQLGYWEAMLTFEV